MSEITLIRVCLLKNLRVALITAITLPFTPHQIAIKFIFYMFVRTEIVAKMKTQIRGILKIFSMTKVKLLRFWEENLVFSRMDTKKFAFDHYKDNFLLIFVSKVW